MPTESSTETVAIQRAQCRHIFTDGHRCGSPCLNKEIFCYYHHATRKPAPRTHRTPAGTRHLPIPEDRPSLLLSIGHVIQAIASKTIDRKDASLLLYAFQVASSALPRDTGTASGHRAQPRGSVREAPAPSPDDSAIVPAAAVHDIVHDIVQDAVFHEDFGIIAPPPEHLQHEVDNEHSSAGRQIDDAREEAASETADAAGGCMASAPAATPEQLTRDEELREAVSNAWYEATKEAAIDLVEAVKRARAEATAETEARLRAQYNLPPLKPKPEPDLYPAVMPCLRAAAAPVDTSPQMIEETTLRVPHLTVPRNGWSNHQLRVPHISILRCGFHDSLGHPAPAPNHPNCPVPHPSRLCLSRRVGSRVPHLTIPRHGWSNHQLRVPHISILRCGFHDSLGHPAPAPNHPNCPGTPSVASSPPVMSGTEEPTPPPTDTRKIEDHGNPNPRPLRHRTLRRLHRSSQQIGDGSGPRRRRY